MHGGKTPRGSALPYFKDGRHSKYLPRGLSDRYQAARTDPDMLSVRDDISLVDARITGLLDQLSESEAGSLWKELRRASVDVQRAQLAGDTEKAAPLLRRVFGLITKGSEESESWQDIYEALRERRKLVETEQKRLVMSQQMLSADQAMTMIQALLSAVIRNVSNPREISAVAAEFRIITDSDRRETATRSSS